LTFDFAREASEVSPDTCDEHQADDDHEYAGHSGDERTYGADH